MGPRKAPPWVVHPRRHAFAQQVRDAPLARAPLRARARRGLSRLEPGAVTVVIVSWNSELFLPTAMSAVRRFADRPVRIVVVDNHSTRSPQRLVERLGGRLVRLPCNTGHSFALDVGFLLARTEFVLALDPDAFPYDAGWMPRFVDPLHDGKLVVGCAWHDWAHPCCLAMPTREFVQRRLSFRPDPVRGWDVGEELSRRLDPGALDLVPRTGPVPPSGTMLHAHFGDVLYHNGYSSRHLRFGDPDAASLDGGITRDAALDAWTDAVSRFCPGEAER